MFLNQFREPCARKISGKTDKIINFVKGRKEAECCRMPADYAAEHFAYYVNLQRVTDMTSYADRGLEIATHVFYLCHKFTWNV